MSKRIAVISGICALILGAGSPAAAGGASAMPLDDHYLIGSSAVAQQVVTFRNAAAAERAMRQRWDLYLVSDWGPDSIAPPEGARLAGELELEPGVQDNVLRAEARLTIPDMLIGRYHFLACSTLGCSSMIGDLYFPEIRVVEATGEAVLLRKVERLQLRVRQALNRARHSAQASRQLREDVAENDLEIRGLAGDRDRLRERLTALENAEPQRSSPLPWAVATGVLVVLAVATDRLLRSLEDKRILAGVPDDDEEDTQPPLGWTVPIEPDQADMSPDPFVDPEDDSVWRRPKEPVG
jgi:hypothetical protein